MTLKSILIALKVIAIPSLYLLCMRFFFGVTTWSTLYSVMSVTFLFLSPTIAGALMVYLSNDDRAKSRFYQITAPWIPIFILFFVTLLASIEGWACWIMILPLFLVAASIGGVLGAYIKFRKKSDKLSISLLALLPFFISPIENMVGTMPDTYEAYTYIDIHASAEKIWDNVTSVKAIAAEQDKGWLTQTLGFPRPVEAVLNYKGIGAYRKAIFTNGLIFHETVSEYSDQKKMVFSIKAYPHEIPSTTMDEHVVIGGAYFDVLNGTYELEKRDDTIYRLHLSSHFKLTTTFNFYASWWARWIMQDIQNNILQVEKARAEQP
jgi:hypothetical protein